MTKILYAAFEGETNSSKLLLDEINSNNKLYLKNSFTDSVGQLENELHRNRYDLVVAFGQAVLRKNTLKIEVVGKGNGAEAFSTKYDYAVLADKLRDSYDIFISRDAGRYLCNNVYFSGLKYIDTYNLNTKMIFIHIPKRSNVSDFTKLARDIEGAL